MRLIDADALMEGITTWQKDLEKEYGWHDAYVQCLDGVISSIESASTASPWHRAEDPPKEEGRYWCATKFAGHWIFYAAWYWNNVSDYTGVPVGKEEKADGFVLGEDVVYPDYWMPIEPPKEEEHGN